MAEKVAKKSMEFQYDEMAELQRTLHWSAEVFNTRRTVVAQRFASPKQYEASRMYTYILAILAALLNNNAVDTVNLKKYLNDPQDGYAKKYSPKTPDVSRDFLIWLIDQLIAADPNDRKIIAQQCCNHHKQICNHCACH